MRNIKTFFCLSAIISFFAFTTFEEIGEASYYADKFQNRQTASGELYDKNKLTCAHKTLPFGTILKVTRLDNNQSVRVKVNDRGPFVKGRIVDLSRVAAEQIGLIKMGLVQVKIEEVQSMEEVKIVEQPVTQPPVVDNKKGSNFGTSIDLIDIKKPAPRPKTQPKNKVEQPVANEWKCFPPRAQLEKARATWVTRKATKSEPSITMPGYGIQVGAYKEYTFMQTSAAQFETQFADRVIRASQYTSSGIIYKILLGTYTDRSAAEKYIESLNLMNINAFVVDLSTLDIMK